jgi:threonine dehydrogenase-like Zn-dependent dehydrogenase
MRAAGPLDGLPVAVLGASTIGLLTLGMATAAGAATIVATDLVAEKRRRALEWGAGSALDGRSDELAEQLREACGERPAVVFDCVGSPATVALALGAVAKGGDVVVLGAEHGEVRVDLALVQDGEVTLTGCAMYTAGDLAVAEAYVAAHDELVSGLVSEALPVTDAARAFAIAGSGQALKVQLLGEAALAGAP